MGHGSGIPPITCSWQRSRKECDGDSLSIRDFWVPQSREHVLCFGRVDQLKDASPIAKRAAEQGAANTPVACVLVVAVVVLVQ